MPVSLRLMYLVMFDGQSLHAVRDVSRIFSPGIVFVQSQHLETSDLYNLYTRNSEYWDWTNITEKSILNRFPKRNIPTGAGNGLNQRTSQDVSTACLYLSLSGGNFLV